MPHANGASYVSEQPDASYFRTPGRRPAEGTGRSERDDRGYARQYGDGYGDQPADDGQGRRRYPAGPGQQSNDNPYRDPTRANPYGEATRGNQYAREQHVPARGQQVPARTAAARRRPAERGLPGWVAVVLLVAIAGASGLIDSLSGSAIRGVFNYGLVLASLVAILLVRRSQMFPVVVAPPLVYLVASGALLYVRSGGLHDRGKLIDAATNWIVYGFPAIAGATAVVLVIAGLRMLTRR